MPNVPPHDPTVKVGGVEYALVYGKGRSPHLYFGAYGPVYVWVAVADPDYVAPGHVSRACDEAYELSMEIEAAERAAGWDPNP